MNEPLTDQVLYRQVLSDFCKTHSEESLYRASLLSATLIEHGFGPDEIVAMHFEEVQAVAQDDKLSHSERIRVLSDAHQFLLEVMIAYGAQYKEYLDLKLGEAVRRAETAELGEREKLEVLAMIAHELGNPLTVALGNMQLAMRFLDSQDVSQVRDLVTDSREALERLAALTSQLVAASQGDGLQLKKEPVDLNHVLRRVRALARNLADEKQVKLEIAQGPESAYVEGDEEALTTITGNLVSNAVRYTGPGGSVALFVECGQDSVAICVSDTGIGLTEDARGRIFEKFFRTDEARRMEPHGLGMGLNIVDRLIKAHNGQVQVESELGRGSTFRVFLPAMKGDANAPGE